ncbi:MAG: hypothetical protein KDD48_06845 [Bdellovibrionales bacterium]|nr:hypothetical protein [Bdellovibrionales bacterium]
MGKNIFNRFIFLFLWVGLFSSALAQTSPLDNMLDDLERLIQRVEMKTYRKPKSYVRDVDQFLTKTSVIQSEILKSLASSEKEEEDSEDEMVSRYNKLLIKVKNLSISRKNIDRMLFVNASEILLRLIPDRLFITEDLESQERFTSDEVKKIFKDNELVRNLGFYYADQFEVDSLAKLQLLLALRRKDLFEADKYFHPGGSLNLKYPFYGLVNKLDDVDSIFKARKMLLIISSIQSATQMIEQSSLIMNQINASLGGR